MRTSDRVCWPSTSGGGIGGLTLAVALGRCDDVDVDIYEQAPELTELGAGISLLPRSWNIMKKLGLDAVLSEIASQAPDATPGMSIPPRIHPCRYSFYATVY